jgi:hypothetical protein
MIGLDAIGHGGNGRVSLKKQAIPVVGRAMTHALQALCYLQRWL